MKTRFTLTIDEKLLEQFKEVCSKYGYKMSPKVGLLIKDFIENAKKL
jgi:antitoxin component of RelBE/YafQ-DinJ toxin-antitoxin module|tara:strand:+ start:38370 stop:38510 length:141 start_codon:yes stop_codon:yes gene_type:complete